ncbi:hypothetical protein BC008_24000 [Mastigocoleus testarum BC008]|uniref:Uncharacterized protein n=1 Tax=Mastigocoleus testarum BC008 TaxID=371196 RepID=A0A0V7ZNB0_9CYAN|nr:hypothetical protein BC008_24000 [Mastigocoleus testarum BC008]
MVIINFAPGSGTGGFLFGRSCTQQPKENLWYYIFSHKIFNPLLTSKVQPPPNLPQGRIFSMRSPLTSIMSE